MGLLLPPFPLSQVLRLVTDTAMTSFIDSPAVFKQRSYEIGISEPQVDLLIAAGFTAMAKVAFCCNFSPGAPDDTPLVTAVTTVLGAAPSAA